MASAEEAKARGNAALSAGNFSNAVKHYTEAIALSPSNNLLYCDRSAAYASLDDHTSALSDAQRAVQLNSSWPACHWRLGAAYHGLHNYSTAISTYQNGLRLAPGNEALKYGLAKATVDSSSAAFGGPFSGLHQQPQMMQQQQNQKQNQLLEQQMLQQSQLNMQQQPHQLLQPQSLLQNQLNIQQRPHQQQQLLQNQLIMQQPQQLQQLLGQQFKRNAINAIQCGRVEQMLGSSPTTDAQMLGFGSSATVLSADLAADASMSTSVRLSCLLQNLAAGAFDLPGDLAKLTEQPSNIWANVQPLWTPKAKERHTSMTSLDIASEAIAMQWQGLQASLGAHEALKRAQEDLEKADAQHKKEKEANDTLTQKNVELEESVNALQTRVKELENNMGKMSEDHAQLNVELKDAASYFGWKARIEMMEEFAAGKHVAWNPSEDDRALFLGAYPPIQTKEKDDPVKEVDQSAQDVNKETVQFEDEETFLIV